MARAGTAAALFLMLVAPLGAQQAKPAFADSVEREFALRRWALEPAHAGEGVATESLDARASRLRALERRRAFLGEEEQLDAACAAILRDVRGELSPEILATLLRMGRKSDGAALDGASFESAASHPLPNVRLAAIEGLPNELVLEVAPQLARLALDPDERVSTAAVDALCLALPATARQVGEVASAYRSSGPSVAWFQLVARLERCEPTRELLEELGRGLEDAPRLAILAALEITWIEPPEWIVSGTRVGSARDLTVAAAWPGPEGFEGLFTRAARVSRAKELDLGNVLCAVLGESGDDFRSLSLLRGALEAQPATEVLASLRGSESVVAALGGYLFQTLEVYAEGLRPEDLEPWRESEQRRGVLELAKALLLDERRPEFGALVAGWLDDGEREISDAAFEALCDARVIATWEERLHEHWRTLEPRRAEAALAELPRGIPLRRFESDFVRLVSDGGSAGMAALELLEALAPLAGLHGIVERWLERELAELERGSAAQPNARGAELRAAGLVRGLWLHAGDACHDTLLRVVARTEERLEISKTAVWALGQDEAGRAKLALWLGPDVPRRLRVEAALARAPFGDERALDVLAEDWKGCDFDLRSRALKAWGASGLERGRAHLERVALDAEQPELLRDFALELLQRWKPPQFEVLAKAAVDRNLDLRRHVLGLLATCGDLRAVPWLCERLKAYEEVPDTPEQRAVREMERDAIWVGLAEAHAVPAELDAQWLAAPLAAAKEQVRARFVGRAQGGTEFAWRAELALADELARTRRLAAVLDATPGWWTLDARLLASIGQRARAQDDPETAARLFVAAGVALLGEAEGEERDAQLFGVRCALLDCWSRSGATGPFLATAERLLEDELVGRGPRRAFEREFGGFDPERGLDGLARLAASLPQALARASLERGDRAAAARELERSAALVGHSRAARAAQAELEALLRR